MSLRDIYLLFLVIDYMEIVNSSIQTRSTSNSTRSQHGQVGGPTPAVRTCMRTALLCARNTRGWKFLPLRVFWRGAAQESHQSFPAAEPAAEPGGGRQRLESAGARVASRRLRLTGLDAMSSCGQRKGEEGEEGGRGGRARKFMLGHMKRPFFRFR